MNQPYKCESEEVFQARLAILKEYIRECNVDGVLDHYCPTSPVLYHAETGIAHVVDIGLSHDQEHMQRVIRQILQTIANENGHKHPVIEYIYA